MPRTSRNEIVIELREAALKVINDEGVWQRVQGLAGRFLETTIEGLTISYRTPFQQMPTPSERVKYLAASHGSKVKANLSYGLDVWQKNRKVLNVDLLSQQSLA